VRVPEGLLASAVIQKVGISGRVYQVALPTIDLRGEAARSELLRNERVGYVTSAETPEVSSNGITESDIHLRSGRHNSDRVDPCASCCYAAKGGVEQLCDVPRSGLLEDGCELVSFGVTFGMREHTLCKVRFRLCQQFEKAQSAADRDQSCGCPQGLQLGFVSKNLNEASVRFRGL
jgi:hypothetical protein